MNKMYTVRDNKYIRVRAPLRRGPVKIHLKEKNRTIKLTSFETELIASTIFEIVRDWKM